MSDPWMMNAWDDMCFDALRQREGDILELSLRVAIELENEKLFGPLASESAGPVDVEEGYPF